MKKPTTTCSALIAVALATMALGACSGPSGTNGASTNATAATSSTGSHPPRQASQRAAVSTPAASESVQNHGGMKVVGSQPGKQYLHDLMQDSDFAMAFSAMDQANKLPAWVSRGGTATPAKTVNVEGKQWLLTRACKPHDCPAEQIALLYRKADHTMQGVFVTDPAPGMGAGISKKAHWTWLGKPDDTVRSWLKDKLNSR